MMLEVGRGETAEGSRLGELYVRHAPEGIRLAFLMTGDRALAEDLVQEAFARFVGRLGHLRDPAAFPSYLRQTIVNLSRSHFRRRKVERAYAAQLSAMPDGERTARGHQAADRTPSEVDEAIHEAMLRLPGRQRAALVLRFYEDLSESQAAAILRCRPGTVRSLVSRGMATLRSELVVVRR